MTTLTHPSDTQTLDAGRPPMRKYGRLGGHTGPMIPPLAKLRAFIFGIAGEGKSALLQSHPDAFIFNFDGTGTTTKSPLATMWPGVDSKTGSLIDDNGPLSTFTWETCQHKIEILIDMARRKEIRPTTICFDSITSWLPMLREYVIRNAQALKLVGKDSIASTWREIDGRSGWDVVYEIVVKTIMGLHSVGYGVFVVGHLGKVKVPLGPDQFDTEYELTTPDGFWKRTISYWDLSAAVVAGTRTVEETKETKTVVRGKEYVSSRTDSREVRAHYFIVDRSDLAGIVKSRCSFPPILLPEAGAWSEVERVYTASVQAALSTSAKEASLS